MHSKLPWLLLSCLAQVGLLSPALGMAQTVTDAKKVIAQYSRRMLDGDVQAMVASMSPVLIDKIGDREKAEIWLKNSFAALRREGLFPIDETIGEIREYADHSIKLYFIESMRFTDGFPNPVGSPYLYLLYTKDKGSTWSVLDLSCVNLKWVHAIAPSFHDEASVRDIIDE